MALESLVAFVTGLRRLAENTRCYPGGKPSRRAREAYVIPDAE